MSARVIVDLLTGTVVEAQECVLIELPPNMNLDAIEDICNNWQPETVVQKASLSGWPIWNVSEIELIET